MTRTVRAAFAASTILLLLACSDAGPEPGLDDELRVHRALWLATRPAAYRYTVERLCFCTPESRGPARVRVSGATVVERRYAPGGDPVPTDLAHVFPAVDGLFEVLDDALQRGADEVRVTWDPDTGVPIDLWIDYDQRLADEELGYHVVAVPEPDG